MQGVAVGLGIDRDRLDAHAARGLDDPAGDLAAIGDQDALEHAAEAPAAVERCGSAMQSQRQLRSCRQRPTDGKGGNGCDRPGREAKQRHDRDFDREPSPPGGGADPDLAERVGDHRRKDGQRGVVRTERAGREPRHRDRNRIDIGQTRNGGADDRAGSPKKHAERMARKDHEREKQRKPDHRPEANGLRNWTPQ